MMDEKEIRRHFAQMREAERAQLPSFAQTYGRARAQRRSAAGIRVRPLMLGAAAAIVITTLWLVKARSFSPITVTPAIATWRAPSDVLLHTPGSEILSTMPALGASVLDKIISTPSNRGT